MATLQEVLSGQVREGELYEPIDRGRVRCYACGHQCPIPEGQLGVCKVPFFHAYPGALAFSFGMLGCDLHCSYCQNWVTSQALRDPHAVSPPLGVEPEELVRGALRQRAKVVVSTYNEPLVTSEWAVAIFRKARAAGLRTAFVSNGNGTPQVLEFLRPWVDLYKVDLKSFDDRHYHELGGRIQPILETIRSLHQMGIWLEIVTLLIPGFNDSEDELKRLTAFLAGVSPDIPWHVTAFRCGPALHLCRQSAGAGRRTGEHILPQLPGAAGGTHRLPDHRLPPDAGGPLPLLRCGNPRSLGARL
jgi:pyruvate formate lyase activating enzyme